MPKIAGQRLWDRFSQVLSNAGVGTIPVGTVSQVNKAINPGFGPSIEVIPQNPISAWAGITAALQIDGSITITGGVHNGTLLTLALEPHTVLGPGRLTLVVP